MKIKLGQIAKNVINGFEGLVIAELNELNGTRQLQLEPTKLDNGKVIASQWFYDYLLEVTDPAPKFEIQKPKNIGFNIKDSA